MHRVSSSPRPRRYTRWELRLDAALHAVGILAGFIGGVGLLLVAARRGGAGDVSVAAVYAVSLIAMLICSAAYNHGRLGRYANVLHGLDHSAIFLMIAGTYTPFTLRLAHPWNLCLTSLVWSVAAGGILLRVLRARLFDKMALALYLTLGWIGLLALEPLIEALEASTLILLLVGGILYSLGVVFHVWARLPFQNAIWHAFVFAAAGAHYAAVVDSI